MTIKECVDFINFWIRKDRGAFLTIDESIESIDNGQLAYYSDIKPKYATSQLIKDTLAPFKKKYPFTPSETVSGYIVVPSNVNYLDLLDVEIQFQISNRTVYAPVKMINEDERSIRLNSQIDPPTVTSPVGEMDVPRYIKLYPTGSGYTGTVTYFKRPVKPVYAYTVISGRVIQYDAAFFCLLREAGSMILLSSKSSNITKPFTIIISPSLITPNRFLISQAKYSFPS